LKSLAQSELPQPRASAGAGGGDLPARTAPRSLLHHCRNPQILKTAVKTALVIGTALAFINHFDGILKLSLTRTEIIQILITYVVPFTVATYSAARHLHHLERLNSHPGVPLDTIAVTRPASADSTAPSLAHRRSA